MNKAYGFLIKRDFKIIDLEHKNDINEARIKAAHDAYLKKFGYIHNRSITIDKINNKVVGQDKLLIKKENSKIKYDIDFTYILANCCSDYRWKHFAYSSK